MPKTGAEPMDVSAWRAQWAQGWRAQELDAIDRALCTYAEKLTQTPAQMTEADVNDLRQAGLDDEQIHDAIQVIAFFNYINRIADAVHVDLDPGMDPYPS